MRNILASGVSKVLVCAIRQKIPTKIRVAMKAMKNDPRYLPITNSNLWRGFDNKVKRVLLSISSWVELQLAKRLKVKPPKSTVEKQVSVAKRNSSPKANRAQSGENQIKSPKNASST